ncbi:MAG: M48 family metallopeptidase [Candidatus Heimdallarchaeota archaeon]|nr:M48 family metallopeptidase [Candidatus Heimdallarchaeota archaeon]
MSNRFCKPIDQEYMLVRSKRRSISIQIHHDKGIVVRAPKWTKITQIEDFLVSKQNWIEKKLAIYQNKITYSQFSHEGKIPFLGQILQLNLNKIDSNRTRVIRKESTLQVFSNSSDPEHLLHKIEKWYRSEALKLLSTLSEKYLPYIKPTIRMKYPEIKIRNYKRRWGSTTKDAKITYNWKLILAPESIIEYVVVHELCHLVYFNHSKQFWNLVSSILPDYNESRKWLKSNGHLLQPNFLPQ